MMKVYENTRSTERPESIVIDEYSVWVYKDIVKDGNEYVFTMIQYGKDEYIRMLHEEVTDIQLALVEVYEGVLANG